MLYGWGDKPVPWSGTVEEELADYERWLTEHAIWSAMAAGQDDPPPDRGQA